MADFYTSSIKDAQEELYLENQLSRSSKIAEVRKDAEILISRAKSNQYAYEFALTSLLKAYPDIDIKYVEEACGKSIDDIEQHVLCTESEISLYKREIARLKQDIAQRNDEIVVEYEKELEKLRSEIKDFERFKDKKWALLRDTIEGYQKELDSNLSAIPYMSRIIADIMTIDLDRLAWSLSWGENKERNKKVASLILLKKEKSEEIERIKNAEYQLAYLLELYPVLQDVIDAEFKELNIAYSDITEMDPVRKYIETEEWENLTNTERNQLALDRYVESRRKSKWQIGRDYELYCGYCYEKKVAT